MAPRKEKGTSVLELLYHWLSYGRYFWGKGSGGVEAEVSSVSDLAQACLRCAGGFGGYSLAIPTVVQLCGNSFACFVDEFGFSNPSHSVALSFLLVRRSIHNS